MNDIATTKSASGKSRDEAAGKLVAKTRKRAPARGKAVAAQTAPHENPDIATQAKRHTKEAIEAFVAVMQDASAPAAARVAAATQILTWGYGKGAGGESDAGERTVRLAWET